MPRYSPRGVHFKGGDLGGVRALEMVVVVAGVAEARRIGIRPAEEDDAYRDGEEDDAYREEEENQKGGIIRRPLWLAYALRELGISWPCPALEPERLSYLRDRKSSSCMSRSGGFVP